MTTNGLVLSILPEVLLRALFSYLEDEDVVAWSVVSRLKPDNPRWRKFADAYLQSPDLTFPRTQLLVKCFGFKGKNYWKGEERVEVIQPYLVHQNLLSCYHFVAPPTTLIVSLILGVSTVQELETMMRRFPTSLPMTIFEIDFFAPWVDVRVTWHSPTSWSDPWDHYEWIQTSDWSAEEEQALLLSAIPRGRGQWILHDHEQWEVLPPPLGVETARLDLCKVCSSVDIGPWLSAASGLTEVNMNHCIAVCKLPTPVYWKEWVINHWSMLTQWEGSVYVHRVLVSTYSEMFLPDTFHLHAKVMEVILCPSTPPRDVEILCCKQLPNFQTRSVNEIRHLASLWHHQPHRTHTLDLTLCKTFTLKQRLWLQRLPKHIRIVVRSAHRRTTLRRNHPNVYFVSKQWLTDRRPGSLRNSWFR